MSAHQEALARRLAALHVPGDPLILYNAWDVGSALAVRDAGAKAIATGSWSVAAANGFADGERFPLDRVVEVARQIVTAVELPVTLDFESGYAQGGPDLEANIARILETGIVGINFEDQCIPEDRIYSADEQARRIEAVRRTADRVGVSLFINARTDVFLRSDQARHGDQVVEAITRGRAYAAAGASGLFVPGIRDGELIGHVCRESSLPVNVLFYPELPPRSTLAELGVARVSYGPRPYRETMTQLTAAARRAIADD